MFSFILSLVFIAAGICGLFFFLRNKTTYFPIPCYYISSVLIYTTMYFILDSSHFSTPVMMILTAAIVYSMLVDNFFGVAFGPAITMFCTLTGNFFHIGFLGSIAGLAIGYIILFAIKFIFKLKNSRRK